ncbi:LysR family transcriptional regulator [Archangium violaceum]|uniref:LysR family transcriptional regulator n=1 Tax=Archangium violaceum TaxID=83451 RepID=UPI002B2C8BB7|nr:LysR family transcriptional regulator [Archangium gephyra]
MEMRHLTSFIALAEELHFGRAAKRVGIVQPALSQHLRQLEEEVGVRLVERDKRRVALTPAGQAFLTHARRSLAEARRGAEAAQRAGRGLVGKLSIGCMGAVGMALLPAVLRTFRTTHPGVQLSMREMGSLEQFQALREGRLDVGLIRAPVEAVDYPVEVVTSSPLMMVVPAGHFLARMQDGVRLEQFAGEDFAVLSRRSEPRMYVQFEQLCLERGFQPRITYEVDQMHLMLELVASGLAVSTAPAFIRGVARPEVSLLPLVDPAMTVTAGLTWDPAAPPSPAREAFLATVREMGRSLSANLMTIRQYIGRAADI